MACVSEPSLRDATYQDPGKTSGTESTVLKDLLPL